MKTLTFILFAILHLNLSAAEYAVFGDAGMIRPELTELRKSIVKEKMKAVVLLGDQIYDSSKTYSEVWDEFRNSGLEFAVVTLGNHRKTYEEEIAYFEMPSEYFTKEFDHEVFIVLNSDNTKNVFAQMKFLYAELKKHQNSKKHLFLVFHHPMATISEFHDLGERWLFQLAFRLVAHKFKEKISAVLVGHDHFSGFYNVRGYPMVLAGGGVELRNGQYPLDQDTITTEYLNDKNTVWVKLATDEKKAVFDYIDVKTNKSLFRREIFKK